MKTLKDHFIFCHNEFVHFILFPKLNDDKYFAFFGWESVDVFFTIVPGPTSNSKKFTGRLWGSIVSYTLIGSCSRAV